MTRRPTLTLKQEDPLQRFVIAGPAQLGRADDINWHATERQIPSIFSELEVAIEVKGAATISRNHAAIYPGNTDSDTGFLLSDLNSMNGTFLNGENTNPERRKHDPRRLAEGDRVRFAHDLELVVEQIGARGADNYALLVAHDGGNLRGVMNDLNLLEEKLVRRGFAGNIFRLHNGDAATENIMRRLEQIAYHTTPDSHMIFHYSGHADKTGLNLNTKQLSPAELYQKLANIRGKKAVILDCCHAGTFIDEQNAARIPPQTLVLAASRSDGKAYEGKTLLAGGEYMGRFTAALVKYLDSRKEGLNLKDFAEALREQFGAGAPIAIKYQEPRIVGASFTILPAYSKIRAT
jgi:hypothetical protein